MKRRVMAIVALCALLCVALQVQPKMVTVDGGIGTEYNHVFTIINDETQPLTVTLVLDDFSTYLEDYAAIEPRTLSILPQESANVQVRGTVPVLGPEVHELTYNLQTPDGTVKGSITTKMPIEGTPKVHPQIDLDANDVKGSDVVAVDATLSNFGNVNAYYTLRMAVREQATLHGEIEYPQLVQVLPGEQELITLLFTEPLEPGDYAVTVHGSVNQEVPLTATTPFRVLIEDGTERIEYGEDLILAIKRYSDVPEVTYIVEHSNKEILRDTIYTEQENITVPFSQLEPGEYELTVRIAHGRGTDTSQFVVVVQEPGAPLRIVGGVIVLLILLGFFASKRGRLELRILRLRWQIASKERHLKTLLRKAERVAHRI